MLELLLIQRSEYSVIMEPDLMVYMLSSLLVILKKNYSLQHNCLIVMKKELILNLTYIFRACLVLQEMLFGVLNTIGLTLEIYFLLLLFLQLLIRLVPVFNTNI